MASEYSFQDIHICGPCRSEFSDISKFIQHKKECYLSVTRGQGQVPDLSHLTEQCIQHLHSSDGLELQLVNTEFHPETYQYSAVPAAEHLENDDGSQTSVQISVSSVLNGTEHLIPDCSRKDHGHYSYSLNSPLVSEHKNLDVATLYSYSWSAEPDLKSVPATMGHVTDNELALVTDAPSHIKNSVSAENVSEEPKNNLDISTDNIAVYVMSSKSFASSIGTQSKYNHNSRSKSLSDFSAGPVWSESHSESDHQNHMLDAFSSVTTSPSASSKRSYISFDGGEHHNDLVYFHQENAGTEMQKPLTSSGFYSDAELVPGSNNSTPCPEDLEVGHISAAMFGKKKQHEDFKIVVSSNSTQTNATASVVSQSDSYLKILLDDVDGASGYIRENTADAQTKDVKNGIDVQSRRRISAEKRERHLGVSDDIMSSSITTSASSTRNQEFESRQTSVKQVASGNITSNLLSQPSSEISTAAAALTSYKAIFTSPSCGGHRLITTQTEHSGSINCSTQGFSNLRKQLFSSGSNSLVSKSVEYKNISATIQNQNKECDGYMANSDSVPLIAGKNSERQINDQANINQLTRDTLKQEINLNHDLTMSAILNHARNATQTTFKPTNKINNPFPSLTSPLNNSLVTSTKLQPSLPKNEEQQHHPISTDFNIELGLVDGSTHLIDSSVLVVSNLSASQAYTGQCLSNNYHVDTNSETKIELPLMTQKDEPPEAPSSASTSNTSIVMIYKNNDGRIIMVPNVLYSTTLQNSSQPAEVVQVVRAATNKIELPFENVIQNTNHMQQQTSDSAVHIDAMNGSNNSAIISQHYYIQNLDTNLINSGQILSSVDGNTSLASSLTSSVGSYLVNQTTGIPSNSTLYKTPTSKVAMTHKSPVSTPRQSESAALEKEKYIIKPKKADGASKSSIEHSNIKRTLQTSPLKETLVSDLTNQEEDKKTRTFTCKFDICRYSTSLYKDFQRHCRRHTGEKPYQCVDCGKTFNRSDKLKLHQRRHSGLKPFQCQFCEYAAIEGGSLKKHMRIHTDERPFKCQICTYASRNSSQLIVHLRTHTGDSPFHCTKCAAKFKINSDLKRHMRIHTGEKPFQCEKCDYKSSNKGNLKTHLRINHLEENEIHCSVCKFVTSSKKRLREHEKSHNVQVIKCPQCDYTCATSSQLRSHIIIHNSLKPFRCNFCSYSSKQSGNLKKHIHNMHLYKIQGRSKNSAADMENGVKPQSTKRENVLLPIAERSIIHKRRSTANCRKLHTCEQCGSNFVREDSLRCHRKQHCASTEEQEKESKDQAQLEQVNVNFQNGNTENNISPAFYGHQGIQQIVAAASKIYEENYGMVAATKSSTVNIDSIVLKEVPDLNTNHCIKNSQSHAGNNLSISTSSSVNETMHHKEGLLQVPWEHRSYTLSDYEKSCLPNNSVIEPSTANFPAKKQPNLLKTKSPQNKYSKLHCKQSCEDNSHHSHKRQASKPHSPQLLKNQRVEKSFLVPTQPPDKPYQTMDQFTQGTPKEHQPMLVTQTLMPTDSINEVPLGPPTESAVFLTQQGADGGSGDSYYNIQLVPQYEVPQGATAGHVSQELHQLPVGTMHIQLQPSAHIQIVMPRTSPAKSAHLVRGQGNPVIPQQQILLQVQDNSEESQLFTIPASSLNTLQATDQVLPHILSHCISQRNGQIDLQAFNNTDSQQLVHPTNQLNESVLSIVNSSVHGLDIVQEAINSKKDPQTTACT